MQLGASSRRGLVATQSAAGSCDNQAAVLSKLLKTCVAGIEDVAPSLVQCNDISMIGLEDLLGGMKREDSCAPIAAGLSMPASEFRGPVGAPGDVAVGCVGNILTVGEDTCADIAGLINEMTEAFLYGDFGGCERTTATTTQTTSATATPITTPTTTPTSTVFGGRVGCAAGFSGIPATPLQSLSTSRSSCEVQAAAVNAMVATCDAQQNGGGGSEAGVPAVACKDRFGTNDLFVVGESKDHCRAVAAVLTAAAAEFSRLDGGSSAASAVTIGCAGAVLSVETAACADGAAQLNRMLELYLGGGAFGGCSA